MHVHIQLCILSASVGVHEMHADWGLWGGGPHGGNLSSILIFIFILGHAAPPGLQAEDEDG